MARKRSLVFGVGINDAPIGAYSTKEYKTWQNMLKRCYCPEYQEKQPTYIGCSVCSEWLVFSKFKEWMGSQDSDGKELDKDLLHPGNREYAPDKCLFISRQINSLLHERMGWKLPQGVWFDSCAGKYRAELTANGKKRYIGVFSDPYDAREAYRRAKADHLRHVARSQREPIRGALYRHANRIDC